MLAACALGGCASGSVLLTNAACSNIGDDSGVQVNVNKPADEAVVRIAPELAPMIKPHQVGVATTTCWSCVSQ